LLLKKFVVPLSAALPFPIFYTFPFRPFKFFAFSQIDCLCSGRLRNVNQQLTSPSLWGYLLSWVGGRELEEGRRDIELAVLWWWWMMVSVQLEYIMKF
jgi:hypothetical protein